MKASHPAQRLIRSGVLLLFLVCAVLQTTTMAKAVHNCTPQELERFSQIYLTLDVTRGNCRKFLAQAQSGEMEKDIACRACAAAVSTKANMSTWFADHPACAADLHADEINKSLEGPASELESLCSQ